MDNRGVVLMQRYELGRLLGQGTFAKVHHARSIRTGESVAIKIINKDKLMRVGLINQIKREISVMRLVKHPYVIELHEVMATKTKIYFVMEYAKGGELFNKLAKGRLKEEVAQKYFQQLIIAVEFCHSRGVYHRDLKPENLLIDDNENLKVSDFGLSAFVQSKRQDGLLHTTCGTPAYVAPEVIKMKGYDGAKVDIWSCGVILFVLLAGYLPFHDSNLMELYRRIAKAEFKFPSWFAPEVRRLLLRILDPNPNTRISLEKIKEHPWFKRGLTNSRPTKTGSDTGTATAFGSSNTANEEKLDPIKPTNINAFNLIGISPGFDLSRLFAEHFLKKETRFASRQPASVIFFKLKEIAKKLRLDVRKKDGGVLKMEAVEEGRKGILSIDAEIFEVTPSFHLVEMKKFSGDTLEYQKVLNEGLRPGLQDIVWAWQGEKEQQTEQQVHLQ